MPFTIGALQSGVTALLNGRSSYNDTLANYARKACLELSENFKFPLLQTTGPVVSLVPLQAVYHPDYFVQPADIGLDVNKVNSFFIFNNPYAALTTPNDQNSGYNLKFSTIDNIEVLINIPGIPVKWTRFENDIWLGSVPDQAYSVYMRYQHENPFSSPPINSNMIQFPNTWQDIMEYAVAMRIARDLNLATKANELYQALYGDNAFQRSGGIEGNPGLIFQRTSQENRDQTTTTKSMRLRMGNR